MRLRRMNNNNFLLYTRCMTYNHSSYIVDAMNGFCMQKTTFPFVNVIVDDASTDGEPEVIEQYLQENFNLDDSAVVRREETNDYRLVYAQHKTNKNCYFVVLYLKYNHYLKKDKQPYYAKWLNSSKYVAICEGDDYWTDPYKLQKQVDFLESHPDYSMCVHAAQWMIGENNEKDINGCNHLDERDLTVDEIILHGGLYVATASTLYRTNAIPKGEERPIWWRMADVGDYPLHIYAAMHGKVHFYPEAMCVYRYQHPGSWTFNQGRNKDIKHAKCETEWMEILNTETNNKYLDSVYRHLYGFHNLLFCEKEISILEYYRKVCRTGVLSRSKFLKQAIQRIFSHSYKVYCRLKYGK